MNHHIFDAFTVELETLVPYTAAEVPTLKLYGYESIDNLHFLLEPEEVIRDVSRCNGLCDAVVRRFKDGGWDGTGCLSLLWIPSFVFPVEAAVGSEGIVVWHVKQHEDGVSWLLSPVALPFEELAP